MPRVRVVNAGGRASVKRLLASIILRLKGRATARGWAGQMCYNPPPTFDRPLLQAGREIQRRSPRIHL